MGSEGICHNATMARLWSIGRPSISCYIFSFLFAYLFTRNMLKHPSCMYLQEKNKKKKKRVGKKQKKGKGWLRGFGKTGIRYDGETTRGRRGNDYGANRSDGETT